MGHVDTIPNGQWIGGVSTITIVSMCTCVSFLIRLTPKLVIVVAYFLRARIWDEGLTNHIPPVVAIYFKVELGLRKQI